MAIMEKEINFVEILFASYEIAELILASEEMKTYIETKQAMQQDQFAQEQLALFQKKKELYEEVQRFGKYHPDYKRVTQEVRKLRRDILGIPTIAAFKKAENTLDELLYHVCRTIADGVSEAIKVPSDNPLYNLGGGSCSTSGGCSTGGSCGCH